MIGIYKITNLINNKIYVGQSIDIDERWKQHIYKAFNSNEKGYNSIIHLAFRKYGIENFTLEVLEECKIEELDNKERYWIKELNSLEPNGYNILVGGQHFRKVRFCEKCGKPLLKGAKQYCLKCYKEVIRENIPAKDELFNKLLEFNGNFSQVGRFYKVSDNTIRKWCKSYNLSYYSKDYKVTSIKNSWKIAVNQIDKETNQIINTFESANEAARFLGKEKGNHITEVCKGNGKTAYGYKWEYVK